MKNLKNIFYITLLSIAGASCSDDLQAPLPDNNGDLLALNFEVPEQIVVNSRAAAKNEGALNNIGVYIFNSNGTSLLQYTPVSLAGGATSTSIGLEAAAKGQAKLVYVVANASGIKTNPANVAELEAIAVNAANGAVPSGDADYFIMSGNEAVGAGASQVSVNLTRLAAKITMSGNLSNFTINNFEIHNPANTALIGAPKGTFGANGNSTVTSAGIGEDLPVYVYPSKSAPGNDTQHTYVIIKATNKSSNVASYYRINLRDDNGALDIKPNHWIKITINSIARDGYASAAEAAKYPEDDRVDAVIHDHAPGVFSMTSDGMRELGTPDEIMWTSGTTNIFNVKWYSPDKDEMSINPEITQLSGQGWVKFEGPNAVETPTENSSDNDEDNPGKRATYTLVMVGNAPAWEAEASFKVTWMGLERQFTVTYNPDFNPETVMSSTVLTIAGTNTDQGNGTINNYWTFIKGGTGTNVLWGANEAGMGKDKIRSNGLHFPMYYDGGRTYSYTIEFDASLFNNAITGVTTTVAGQSPLNDTNVKWTADASNKGKGTLTFSNGASYKYNYAVGTVNFHVKYKGENNQEQTVDIPVPLYHTGFFWKNSNTSYGTAGWYYYEVVEMAGSGDSKYWLDRNIGAKSCENYVESSTKAGNEDAAGAHVAIGTYGNYASPTITSGICPAGFHVPTKAEFDAVRTSKNFVTDQEVVNNVTVYTTYFKSPNALAGNIYFPKAKYYNNSTTVKSGDDASGYYWSQTEASGLEKDQIGHWIYGLYMSGGSNTWINSDVQKHRMSVRAVAGATAPVENKTTLSFNVKGATHVYIYDTTPGNGLFTFPGKAVCTYEAAKANTVINFTYTTSSSTSNLYIYLATVDNNGKITVHSVNGSSKASEATGVGYTKGATYTVSNGKTVKQ